MLDLNKLDQYRENNRIEAKKAVGGLPDSLWETYSAFANTLGGVVLLGVEEYPDKSLHPIGLLAPDWLLTDLWEIINDPQRVSQNILRETDVQVRTIEGKRIIVINVPRARRMEKPVFIGGDITVGTYRRSGDGDYRCTPDEVLAMQRDAAYRTQDMRLLRDRGTDVFDYDSVRSYRMRMSYARPGHIWGGLEDREFLHCLGALGEDENGELHPTAAGLLMFGRFAEIRQEFPCYSLTYQEQPGGRNRILSGSEHWSGNLYDFYNRVDRVFSRQFPDARSPVHTALREALANCIIHADYCGKQGIIITRQPDRITFSNPGIMRIDRVAAHSGGISDPRNDLLIRMFFLIDVGERVGSGIPGIFHTWREQGWSEPILTERFDPEHVTLTLVFGVSRKKRKYIPSARRSDRTQLADARKDAIIDYLTDHVSGTAADLAPVLRVRPTAARRLLRRLVQEGIVTAEERPKKKVYRLLEKSHEEEKHK
jgi:predicted HTH transcriptional regulator